MVPGQRSIICAAARSSNKHPHHVGVNSFYIIFLKSSFGEDGIELGIKLCAPQRMRPSVERQHDVVSVGRTLAQRCDGHAPDGEECRCRARARLRSLRDEDLRRSLRDEVLRAADEQQLLAKAAARREAAVTVPIRVPRELEDEQQPAQRALRGIL